jgi:hypothetical protein
MSVILYNLDTIGFQDLFEGYLHTIFSTHGRIRKENNGFFYAHFSTVQRRNYGKKTRID